VCVPPVQGWRKPDLRMIELVWRAHGRFAIGEESARDVNINQPTVIQEPGDGRALLELVREKRLEMEREKAQRKPIDTTAVEVGTS
jgi:hypothetical protein